jgi:hypothetical protein
LANFLDQITIIRRFLRDPDALIWDSEQLCIYWNEAQVEIAQKVSYLQRARSLRYPSQYTIVYFYPWEYQYTEGDRMPVLQYAQTMQQLSGGVIVMYPWEASYDYDYAEPADDGYRNMHQWEAYYGLPADPPHIALHDRIQTVKYVAFDEKTITGISERELAIGDGGYRTVQGDPMYYYFPDHFHNQMILYPRPSITLDDDDTLPPSGLLADTVSVYTDKAYTQDWEYDNSHAGTSVYQFGHEYSTSVYLYDWEYQQLNGDSASGTESDDYIYMRYWEYTGEGGIPGLAPETADEQDTGLATDNIGTEGQLFLVYDYLPTDVEDYSDDITDWPPYMFKTIISGVLERAYGANTDGCIPSLRDFWKMRKEIGIKAINIFRRLRSRDRDYRLGGSERFDRQSSHPRLPSHFPAQEV